MLFSPLTLRCGLVLPNRIALAPLTNVQSHADGLLGDAELEFLARRADGGFGLISTCAAYVARDGKAWDGELAIDRDACLPGLRRLATRLHDGGARAIVQLFHGGARADAKLTGETPWSASTWTEDRPGFVPPRTATADDVHRVTQQFAEAAARAEAAGFDGVELHGAHGYLLSQYLSRTQHPGATLVERAALIRGVMQACRARCSPGFAIGVRLSFEDFGQARGLDLDESLEVARWLVEDGADFLHASLWDVSKMSTKRPDQHVLTMLRAALPAGVAIFTAGKIWSREDAELALERGADVVALGRSAIVNPSWPHDIAGGRVIQQPPVTPAELEARAVSPRFVSYLRAWKGFIADQVAGSSTA